MDLGIAGRRAIVCASSRGLGLGCATHLAAAGVHCVLNGRDGDSLARAADRLAGDHGVEVSTVAADVTTEEGRAAIIEAEPAPDILINNAGGPPPGVWSQWDRQDWLAALEANMIAPIMLTKAVLPGMMERGWGRVVSITSASVKAPIPHLGLSNGARAGLTGFVAGTARQVAPHGVVMNNLLPGLHDTERARSGFAHVAREKGISPEEAERAALAGIPAGRMGDAGDFGAICAFLCSVHAGFIVGQNILADGGAFNATLT